MGGGGGSNSGAADANKAAARSEAQKQIARNSVNAAFGIAPSMDGITDSALSTTSNSKVKWNPTTGQFSGYPAESIFNPAGNYIDSLFGGTKSVHSSTDHSAYNAAVADYTKELADSTTNKTARDSLYDTVRSDSFNAGRTGLDDTKSTAARNNKFALFAQGLNGGSADVDESALLDRTYSQGLLDLGAKADLAKSTLKGNDETTRLGLLQSVDNGMNQSDALTSALTQMKTGADTAEAQAQGTNLGDLFAGAGLLYTKSNAARGAQAGLNYWNGQYPTGAMLSGNSNSGIVTKTGG